MLRFVSTLALMAVAPVAIAAGVPMQINHQGVVSVNGLRFTGNGDFKFAIVNPATGIFVWTNDNSTTGTNTEPTNAVMVPVTNGVYSVALGDMVNFTSMTEIPASLFSQFDSLKLRIWFSDGVNGSQQLSPDQPLTTSPYAFRAAKADNVDHLVIPESTTTALVVDAQGKVGIGTNTPAAELDVVGDVAVSGTVDGVDVSGHAADANAHLGPAGGDLSGAYPDPSVVDDSHSHTDSTVSNDLSIDNGRLFAPGGAGNVGIGTTSPQARLSLGTGVGAKLLTYDDGAGINQGFFIDTPSPNDLTLAVHHTGSLVFAKTIDTPIPTVGTEFMRISNSGRVGIGGLPPGGKLHVSDPVRPQISFDDQATRTWGIGVSATQFVIIDVNTDATHFGINPSGVVSGTFGAYHGPSDGRLKKDVVTIPNALARVLHLRGINFKWKDSHTQGDSLRIGMISQEVEKVFPESVHTADDKMKTKAIEYPYLVAALVEAIKELDGIVKQKDAELAGERARIDALESRLIGLEARLPKLAQTEMSPSMP